MEWSLQEKIRFGVREDKLTLGEDSALPKRCLDVIVILTVASFTKAQTNNKWNSPREPATAQIKENVALWLGDTTELYSRTEHLLYDTCRTWKPLRLRVSTTVMKRHDRKQLGEGDIYSAYTSVSLFINEGRRGRNSNWAGI